MLIKIIFRPAQAVRRWESVMSSFEVYVKSSSEIIRKELETTKRKKQALDNLFSAGKISQATYDYIAKDLDEAINEVESRQKILTDKLTSKIGELEEQTSALEMFLANLEIGHATGEFSDELYQREGGYLSLGLENAKRELTNIRDTLLSIIPEEVTPAPTPEPSEAVEAETEAEAEKTEEAPTEEEVAVPEEGVSEAPSEEEAPVAEETEVPVQEEEKPLEETPPPEEEIYFEAPLEETTQEGESY